MEFEVVVVGGGIGGLTAAALLAARGFKVGLFERQSSVGGCAANVSHLGYQFEPTYGLYTGWESGGTFDRIFSGLPVGPPAVEQLSPSYTVRLPDGLAVSVSDSADFYQQLRLVFPECATAAVHFYEQLAAVTSDEHNAARVTVAARLHDCSHRFRRFLDVQLPVFTGAPTDACPYDQAALALDPHRRFWNIRGGAQSLVDTLAASFKASGGTLRLNSPVLRLAYGTNDLPVGIDLLNGERVTATRVIVSNLTLWDTYGKLVGMTRTPPAISSALRKLHGWGAYLVFLAIDRSVSSQLPSHPILALSDWQESEAYDPESAQFLFSAGPTVEAESEKQTATLSAFTNAQDWFSFHEDHTAHETEDQSMLEAVWSRLHAAMPELGEGVEVIETATPQSFYESTRRKLGMVGGVLPATAASSFNHPFANLFLVGDTAATRYGIEGTAESAYAIAQTIAA